MQGNEGIVGESAATFRDGGFVSITGNNLSNRHNHISDAGDLSHDQLDFPASSQCLVDENWNHRESHLYRLILISAIQLHDLFRRS
jgi:hypothetical protein